MLRLQDRCLRTQGTQTTPEKRQATRSRKSASLPGIASSSALNQKCSYTTALSRKVSRRHMVNRRQQTPGARHLWKPLMTVQGWSFVCGSGCDLNKQLMAQSKAPRCARCKL